MNERRVVGGNEGRGPSKCPGYQDYLSLSWEVEQLLLSPLCVLVSAQKGTISTYPSVVNCGQDVKRQYAVEVVRGVSGLLLENSYFAQVVVSKGGIAPGWRPLKPGDRDPVVPLKATMRMGWSSLALPSKSWLICLRDLTISPWWRRF